MEQQSDFLIYQSDDGVTRIETRLENETVWLTQAVKKAEAEYAKYKAKAANELSRVEKDFVKFIDQTAKQLENKKKK